MKKRRDRERSEASPNPGTKSHPRSAFLLRSELAKVGERREENSAQKKKKTFPSAEASVKSERKQEKEEGIGKLLPHRIDCVSKQRPGESKERHREKKTKRILFSLSPSSCIRDSSTSSSCLSLGRN